MEAIEHAEDLINATAAAMDDSFIDEWLHRLNLLHLKPKFEEHKIRRQSEMKFITEEKHINEEYKLTTEEKEKSRIWNMMRGEEDSVEDYQYLNDHRLRQVAASYAHGEEILDEILA
jgi:hypothetical protein